jgi:D-serine deaminase-like pyridoxal phosphate-dependent protein
MTAPQKTSSVSELSESGYRIDGIERVLTPALAIYSEHVDSNIAVTLGLLGGDAGRWRPHVKTAKLACIMRRMVERGILNFKCATTLELATVCEVGAEDVLLGYPAVARMRDASGNWPAEPQLGSQRWLRILSRSKPGEGATSGSSST